MEGANWEEKMYIRQLFIDFNLKDQVVEEGRY